MCVCLAHVGLCNTFPAAFKIFIYCYSVREVANSWGLLNERTALLTLTLAVYL